MKRVRLVYPFTLDSIRGLKVGHVVTLSGPVFTARDRLHKYLFDGGACPVDLRDGAIYHCGPVVVARGEAAWSIRAAGPTTSAREEPYMATLIEEHHIRIIIGKGGMGEATRRACKQFGCVYLQAVGGAASVLASRIEEVEQVHFLNEFGSAEAMWTLRVAEFEAVVTIDTRGWSLHDRIRRSSRKGLQRSLAAEPPFSEDNRPERRE